MMHFNIFHLRECHNKDRERVGNKARNLGKIMEYKERGYCDDFEVPNGVVVDSNLWRNVYNRIEETFEQELKKLRIAKSREEIDSMMMKDPFFNEAGWVTLENLTNLQMEKKREELKKTMSQKIIRVLTEYEKDILGIADKFKEIHDWPDVEAIYIRSSTDISDSEENPHAGIFGSTPIWKEEIDDIDEIVDALTYCFIKIFHQIGYLAENQVNISDINLALICQVYYGTEINRSGTIHVPTLGKRDQITIGGGWGVCSYFVDGGTGDSYVIDVQLNKIPSFRVNKNKCNIRRQDTKHTIGSEMDHTLTFTEDDEKKETQKISGPELLEIASISWCIKEEIFGHPQVIEFSLKKGGTILILQSRPQPLWS